MLQQQTATSGGSVGATSFRPAMPAISESRDQDDEISRIANTLDLLDLSLPALERRPPDEWESTAGTDSFILK